MNGEIPSVPITTLAGIASLTDLLPELPLPSPLPSSVSNKSLLFHPRVAEEARRLLNLRDEPLANQLVQALSQTSTEHIELKDHYVSSDCLEGEFPELLKAIQQRNPHTLKGVVIQGFSHRNSQSQMAQTASLSHNSSSVPYHSHISYSQPSPYPSPHLSPYSSQLSPSRYTPQDSPRSQAQGSPGTVLDVKPKIISVTSQVNGSTTVLPIIPKQEPLSPLSSTRSKSRANSPAQATTTTPYLPQSSVAFVSADTSERKFSPQFITRRKPSLAEPVVVLNKLTKENLKTALEYPTGDHTSTISGISSSKLLLQEQALAQRSVREFNLKTSLAQVGSTALTGNCKPRTPTRCRRLSVSSDRSGSWLSKNESSNDESDSSEDEPLAEKRRKENNGRSKDGLVRAKCKTITKRQRSVDDHFFLNENAVDTRTNLSTSSLSERVKRRKRSTTHATYAEYPDNLGSEGSDDACLSLLDDDSGSFASCSVQNQRQKFKKDKLRKSMCSEAVNLTPEELMDTNTYKRFTSTLEMIFDVSEDLDLTAELDEDAEIPPEALIPKYQLAELCSEAAKLKNLKAVEQIPVERLVRLLSILERNIRDGAKLLPIQNPDEHDEDEGKLWLELTMERVTRSVDASLTALYVMTSPNMPKQVYLEDVIERVVSFSKYQLQNTIFPVFDPVYRVDNKAKDGYLGNIKQKRARAKEVKQRAVLQLYNKLHELVTLLADLLEIQQLTDTTVLQLSTLGVSPFFVENVSELQLSALRLVTTVFSKYEKHRQLILEDVLASLARLPTSKRSLRNYRLNSEENIQMVTALILQLIQCVVQLPKGDDDGGGTLSRPDQPTSPVDKKLKVKNESDKRDNKADMDKDVLIITSYEMSLRTALNFLSVFLKKCSSKGDELDYRPLFENFVQDLLSTVNKPEWPAAELLLSILGRLLVQNFSNKSLDMGLRVASLEYLGAVASRLRKDAVSSQLKKDTIEELVKTLNSEVGDEEGCHIRNSKNKKLKSPEPLDKLQVLQKALLDYLNSNLHRDPALLFSKQFYIAQWFRDASKESTSDGSDIKPDEWANRNKKDVPLVDTVRERHCSGRTPTKSSASRVKKKKKRKILSSDEEDEDMEELEDIEDEQPLASIPRLSIGSEEKTADVLRLAEKRKKFLLEIIKSDASSRSSSNLMSTVRSHECKVGYDSAELIVRFLASKRPFSQSFDIYLSQILRVLNESAIAVRTKAMKCLSMVVEADPGILARLDMQNGVHGRFLDHSTSVREAAVDLVGKFILIRPELTDQYYSMLIERILDTGVSVRKRVIKILKDVCIEQPEFSKIPEICVKMIRRVNDEDGIKKLVNEVFQNMWFSPVRDRDMGPLLLRKVMNITEVVSACKDTGLDWFEQLLQNLLKQKEDKEEAPQVKQVLKACRQIVDCLVQNVLILEENAQATSGGEILASQRLVACLTTLHLFAKIKPDLLVPHATTLQPYLSLKCNTQGDYLVLHNVARTLELVVPLMEHPSETFLAQLEENMIKLILRHGMMVIQSCVSCLGAVVNNVTRNYKLVRDCFQKYFTVLQKLKVEHEQNPNSLSLQTHQATLKRSLFTVGLFCRYFDFDSAEAAGECASNHISIKEVLFDDLLYFMRYHDEDVRHMALTGLGSMCIRHYDLMLGRDVKDIYNVLLTEDKTSVALKCQVLKNIQTYLQEEEIRMIKQDSEWSKQSKKEDLKEMGDVTSGMASTVIQLYLKQILESYVHVSSQVRNSVLLVIQLILSQGLVHPVQIVPYLICMSTDTEHTVRTKSDQQLQEIEKKYPGFIQMKAIAGVKMSYRLQKIIQKSGADSVRGFRPPAAQGESSSALNGYLYTVVRGSRQHRRAFILALLKQFDEQVKTSLAELLFLADNLAYFPYVNQDEPLFVIHHIDIFISVTGSNLLQSFREMTIGRKSDNNNQQSVSEGLVQLHKPTLDVTNPAVAVKVPVVIDEDDDEDMETILERLPPDVTPLRECMAASQGCLLLLVLKQHLKDMYGFTDGKIHRYSPAEAAKVYEKSVSRKNVATFTPKATLEILRQDTSPAVPADDKKNLVQQYLEFKELMLSIDQADDEEDEESTRTHAVGRNVAQTRLNSADGNVNGREDADGSMVIGCTTMISPDSSMDNKAKFMVKPVAKRKSVCESPRSKPRVKTPKSKEKPKKKVKKKRRRFFDSDEDSSDGDSDPDFTA